MKKELQYILAILKARFKSKKMFFGFDISFNHNKKQHEGGEWEATIKYGVPETCACIFYIGLGDTEIEALEDCLEKVLLDEPLITEMG